jgi:hypothetical protein
MTAIQIVGLIAVVLFLGFAFFKLVRWTCAEWKKIEAEEEDLRQARLRAITRSGYEIQ